MRVAAIDLSMTATGIATYDDRAPVPMHTSTVASKPTEDGTLTQRDDRQRAIIRTILGRADPRSCDLVIIEGPSYGSQGAGTWDRAGLWWRLVAALVRYDGAPTIGMELAICPPSNSKIYATGKGNASKAEVQIAVQKRWPQFDASNDNESDAAAMCAAALHKLGQPLCEVPLTHVRALKGIAWPSHLEGK